MTLLNELMQKRAAMRDSLANIFLSQEKQYDARPLVRSGQIRGNSGQDHIIREGKQLENVSRTEHTAKGKTEASVRRLLGLFGADD